MTVFEIVLLVCGGIIFILSFVVPVSMEEKAEETRELASEEIKKLVTEEMDKIKSHVDDVVDESIEYAMEKTERSLERLSNEKIMAVNEYSETVLNEIHKNHEEVVFLYDMLNDKHTNIKDTVLQVNETVKAVEETKKEAKEAIDNFRQLAPAEKILIPKVYPVNDAEYENGTEKGFVVKNMGETQNAVSQNAVPKTSGNVEEQTNKPNPGKGRAKRNSRSKSGRNDAKKDVKKAEFERLDADTENTGTDSNAEKLNKNEEIINLYKNGKSAVEIAKELDLGVGEVELVISLYRKI